MKIRILILITSLFCSTIVMAQNKKRYIYAPKSGNTSKPSASNIKISDLIPETVHKDIYRIDVLLPIQLNLLPSTIQYTGSWPQNSIAAMHFYEGLMIAIDSLEKNEDMYYDIYVHDIGNANLDSLLNSNTLDSTDVIIAGIHSQELQTLSDYSLKHRINTFSVFSPADGNVRNNPFFFIFQPTLHTHLEEMIQYAEKNYSRYHTTILYRETPGDDIAFTLLKTQVRRKHNELKISEDKIDIEKLKTKLAKTEINLIYTTFISPESTTHILNQLSQLGPEYEIFIMGLPSWKSLPVLTNNTLPSNINVIIPYAFKYDDDDNLRMNIRNQYSKYQRGFPSEYTYRGYESVIWVADMLKKHGQYFNNNLDEPNHYSTEFDYQLTLDNNDVKYFENKKIYFFKYHNSRLQLVN